MKPLLSLFPYLKKYKKKLLLGFLFIIISIAFNSLYPVIIGNAIDQLKNNFDYGVLLRSALLSVGSVLLGGIFLFLIRQNIIVVSRKIENDLRYDFFSHLQKLSTSFYSTNTTGNIMALATNDISNIRAFIGPAIMYAGQTSIRTLVIISILLSINPSLTLYALIPLPFISLFVYKIGRKTFERSMRVQNSFSEMTTSVQENISGIRVIKSYSREDDQIKRFTDISADYQKKNLYLARIQSFSFPMMFLITGVSTIIVIYFGGLGVMNGTMTIGNIAQFILYLGQLTWPMIAIGSVINLVQRAGPSMQRLLNVMDISPEITDLNQNGENSHIRIQGKIEFKNVSFKYPDTEKEVLKNISFSVKKASTLGIIGLTGAGKSTLINLLPRMYDVTSGEIFIDNINIKKIPLKILRTSIGIVPQESFLFSDTLEKNIAYSEDEPDMEKVLNSAKLASLYNDIMQFPDSFNTFIGERGITLSGGQKQRTSLARAIYKDPEILILDDALSAVDTNTEEEILQSLKEVMKDRTTIIIAHRISSIKNADNIIVIENGTISEEGNHQELMSNNGLYAEIYYKQLLEEEIKEY